jgi:hypothetical protein
LLKYKKRFSLNLWINQDNNYLLVPGFTKSKQVIAVKSNLLLKWEIISKLEPEIHFEGLFQKPAENKIYNFK